MISEEEFEMIMQSRAATRSFEQLGVDVVGLCDLADYMFMDGREIPLEAFMELVVELRGTNHATVKDIVDLRRFVHIELQTIQSHLDAMITEGKDDKPDRHTHQAGSGHDLVF